MMSEEPQSSGSEPVTSVVGRLLQHIVALLEARVDLTRQEMRASLRDVAIALFLLIRSEEHTSELQSRENLVCRLLLEKKKLYCQLRKCLFLLRLKKHLT